MKALVLIAFGLAGCGAGYRCEGPACGADSGAAIDAGPVIPASTCAQNCYPGCCDVASGQCVRLADTQCRRGDSSASDVCVACGTGQACVRYLDTGRCEAR